MAHVTIQIRDNGPYLIRGGVTLHDANGKTYELQDVVALCRCGHSTNKPFCDGAHKANNFASCPRVQAEG